MLPCEPSAHPPVDLVNVEAETGDDVDLARFVCDRCPVLETCRQWALRNDVAGVCGGLTEAERTLWRRRRGIRLTPVTMADIVPARMLTSVEAESLPAPQQFGNRGTLPNAVRDTILRMTAAGVSAADIVDRLNRDDVTDRTVNYVRRTYQRRDRTYIEVA